MTSVAWLLHAPDADACQYLPARLLATAPARLLTTAYLPQHISSALLAHLQHADAVAEFHCSLTPHTGKLIHRPLTSDRSSAWIRALPWGGRGRKFESCRSDQIKPRHVILRGAFFMKPSAVILTDREDSNLRPLSQIGVTKNKAARFRRLRRNRGHALSGMFGPPNARKPPQRSEEADEMGVSSNLVGPTSEKAR